MEPRTVAALQVAINLDRPDVLQQALQDLERSRMQAEDLRPAAIEQTEMRDELSDRMSDAKEIFSQVQAIAFNADSRVIDAGLSELYRALDGDPSLDL